MLELAKIHPHSDETVPLIAALNKELWEMYPNDQEEYASHNHLSVDTTLVVARLDGVAVAIGALRPISTDPAAVEVKRMYTAPAARQRGISKAILAKLESLASADGYTITRLETGTLQAAAIALYEKAGYKRIPNYPPYVDMPDSICYEKVLGS